MYAFWPRCSGPSISAYRVVLVTDALCSCSDATHDALLTVYHQRFAQQVETVGMETVLSNWT